MNKEFFYLIRPIIKHPNFQMMKNFKHHKNCSTYYHSLKVAYLAYKYVTRNHKNVNLKSLIRGALLHDYYLYDWHDSDWSHRPHGYKHPKIAFKNALRDFPDLNIIEKDIILHHMFPLTIVFPKTKEGWIVSFCDKVAGFSDYKTKKKDKK